MGILAQAEIQCQHGTHVHSAGLFAVNRRVPLPLPGIQSGGLGTGHPRKWEVGSGMRAGRTRIVVYRSLCPPPEQSEALLPCSRHPNALIKTQYLLPHSRNPEALFDPHDLLPRSL